MNPYDNKPFSIVSKDPKTPGQGYLICAGQPDAAIRGMDPGNRYELAVVEEDGISFNQVSSTFIEGPVCIQSDADAIEHATWPLAEPIQCAPRGAEALVIVGMPAAAPTPAAEPPAANAPDIQYAKPVPLGTAAAPGTQVDTPAGKFTIPEGHVGVLEAPATHAAALPAGTVVTQDVHGRVIAHVPNGAGTFWRIEAAAKKDWDAIVAGVEKGMARIRALV